MPTRASPSTASGTCSTAGWVSKHAFLGFWGSAYMHACIYIYIHVYIHVYICVCVCG
jgi:hypothetical protein